MAHLHLNYIGSKKTLFDKLDKVFQKYITNKTVFGDMFAGTGTVAFMIQEKYKCKVITNDLQYYAYVLNRAILTKYTQKEQNIITKKIEEYNNINGFYGFMARRYSPPSRMYFTRANAMRIDAMRIRLEKERKLISDNVYYYLLASIIVAADKVANTSSIYASYLKEFKPSALRKLTLSQAEFSDISNENIFYNENVVDIIDKVPCDVIYLDPPYNTRQYSTYYHILETIARYDAPKIHGMTGVRDELQKSTFSSAAEAEASFRSLVTKTMAKVLIMSYNDEGIVDHSTIRKILRLHGKVKMYKIPYKKFKAQQNIDREILYEYLFVSIRT